MLPIEVLRNIVRLLQLISQGSRTSIPVNPHNEKTKDPYANRPIPVKRNICPHCKLDIPEGARVCHHCHQYISLRFNLANIITLIALIAAVSMSVYSLYMTATTAQLEKNIQSRRFLIETLQNMQQIQDQLQASRSKTDSEDNLNEKEILLLNYYEVLSRTLAQYIKQEPTFFKRMRCTNEPLVRIRQSPTTKSKQIGTIYKGEEVFKLGSFSYGKGEVWYFVVSADQQKIGWVYKYLEPIE